MTAQFFARCRALALVMFAPLVVSCSSTTEPAPDPIVASIDVTLAPALLAVRQSAVAVATAKDSSGKVLPNARVSWTIGEGATVDDAGRVTATRTGYTTVRANVGSVEGHVTFRVVPLPAIRLLPYREQTAPVRSGAPNNVQSEMFFVSLQDSTGTLVPESGVVITASVQGATVSGTTTAATNESGYAVFNSLIITGASGPKNLAFSAAGLPAISIPITLTSGIPSAVAVTGNNQQGISGWGTEAISVRVTDTDGNPIPRTSVTFAVATGNGRIIVEGEPVSSVQSTDANGVAGIPSWRLGAFGTNTLSVTVAGIPTPTIISAHARHRVTLASIVLPQPTIVAGQSVQATIRGIDENGVAFTPPDRVEWFIVGGAGAITQTGIVTGTAAGTGTIYIRVQGATAQADYSVTGVAATKLVLKAPVSGIHVGGKLAVAPEVQIVDAATGTPVAIEGRAVTVVHFPSAFSPTTLSGTLTVLTDATGTARFTDLAVVGPANSSFVFDFISTGSIPVASVPTAKSP